MFKSLWKILAGMGIFAFIIALPAGAGLSRAGQDMAACAALMALWWMTEAIPISATALLPLVLFPVMGITSAQQAASPYANHLIYLFMGGFILALAIEKWNLHKRIALRTVWIIGFSESRLLLGFMIATGFISMWISNTAAAMIMIPIGMAVVARLIDNKPAEPKGVTNFGTALMLGIAYSASIGGIGTLIGTPPNLVLANTLEKMYGIKISFGDWLKAGLPMLTIFLPISWFYLSRIAFKLERKDTSGGREIIRMELAKLGRMSYEEKVISLIFISIVFLWIFSSPKDLGGIVIPGVQSFIPFAEDSTIAIFGALLLFVIPAGKRSGQKMLIKWKDLKELPWGILILFGGGLSLAEGFRTTGLAEWIGTQVQLLAAAPQWVTVAGVITLVVFSGELTSNTAATAMILPVLAGVADGIGINPLLLMIPATVAASCGFMLPAGTPPNALVFGTGQITIPIMAKKGLVMDLIGIVLITILTYTVIVRM